MRFVTFANTGDYDVADGEPRFPAGSYENLRLRFLRTQRDEVDAIEAFGKFLWDIRFRDFQAEYDLARITWDESRHTEIGHRALLTAGYDPFELPNRLTGSTCRGPMEPAYAMAEINLFGEVGVLKTINSLIDVAVERHDDLLYHAADFIRSDERTHVRKGRHIIRTMTDAVPSNSSTHARVVHRMSGQLGVVKLDMTCSRFRVMTLNSSSASRLPSPIRPRLEGTDLQTPCAPLDSAKAKSIAHRASSTCVESPSRGRLEKCCLGRREPEQCRLRHRQGRGPIHAACRERILLESPACACA